MTISAIIETNQGTINLQLYSDETPVTVANFINLGQRGYYNGLAFHRVISDFMIQGGCPLGTGTGDPGYRFEDEFSNDLKHNRPGILSMANAGPGTNGSQFFITHVATPHLDGNHSVFGAVVDSQDQDVVNSISQGDHIVSMEFSGDVQALLEAQSGRIAQWNEALATAFPDL